jgi:hypothetical protein
MDQSVTMMRVQMSDVTVLPMHAVEIAIVNSVATAISTGLPSVLWYGPPPARQQGHADDADHHGVVTLIRSDGMIPPRPPHVIHITSCRYDYNMMMK